MTTGQDGLNFLFPIGWLFFLLLLKPDFFTGRGSRAKKWRFNITRCSSPILMVTSRHDYVHIITIFCQATYAAPCRTLCHLRSYTGLNPAHTGRVLEAQGLCVRMCVCVKTITFKRPALKPESKNLKIPLKKSFDK